MGKPTGFIEVNRKTSVYRNVKKRIKDYKDVLEYLSNNEIENQASRCMDCGIPFCHATGCPLHNLIPEWNDLIYKGQWKDALERLLATNSLPEITGRVCPATCETSCTLSINNSPVTIKEIELAIIENGFKQGWVKSSAPDIEIKKKIAIIGSGPAGLSAAQTLRKIGYNITVFEKSDQAGGILRYGIPDFKLEKWVLDRRINLMKTSGIKFETEVNIGVDLSYRYMKKSFDVILLTTGAGEPRDLKIPGRELDGIDFAMDYLTESNLRVKGTLTKDEIISAEGKNVLVIGGGDTGSDCVGTANRQGAKKVYQFEIMKKPDAWDKTWNPVWPEWPMILRTSSSHEEGVNREWSILIKKFTGKNNNVEEAHCLKIDWKASKKDGRLQMNEIPESKFVLKIDMVFLAMGFLHTEYSNLLSEMGLEIDEKGNLKTFADYTTSVDGVFAAGDSDTGASLVVQAIYHGQESAKKIHEYILKKSDI